MSAERSIMLSLRKLSGGGVVNNYKFENESNFTAIVRTKSGSFSDDKNTSFYNKWCANWIQTFSQETSTNWIVRYTYPGMQKCNFKKVFKCQHNSFDKVKKMKRDDTSRQRNKGCDATITIRFKKINRHTMRNDPLLKLELDVHIQISYHHTHKINVVEANRYLRITPDTQETFLKYFKDGMTPAAARGFHETKLEFETDDNEIPVVLSNAQINPTERQVKHLYYKWRKEHYVEHELALGENVSPEFYDVGNQDKNCIAEMINTVDDGNQIYLREDHSAATGYNEIKLEDETVDSKIPVALENAQISSSDKQEKHSYCKWKEDHFGGGELALGENMFPELYHDMSTDMEIKTEMLIDTEQANKIEHQDNDFTEEIINTGDDANEINICEKHSAGAEFHDMKLENEPDENEIPEVKHLNYEWREEHISGSVLAVGEIVSPKFHDDMSTYVETKNKLSTNTEQINKVEYQDNSFAAEIINTVNGANETSQCKEHSAALLELSGHFERISKIASNSKTVEMTNAIKKLNETLNEVLTPTDILNFLHT